MTTEELLWNAAFEDVDEQDTSYDYREELANERYYNNKDLFEQLKTYRYENKKKNRIHF